MPEKPSKTGDSEKDDKPEKRANRLEKTIEDSAADLERTTGDISTEIGKKQETLKKEVTETNSELTTLKQDLNKNAAELRARTKASVGWIRTRVENLEILAYAVALFFGIIYVVTIFLLSMPLGWQTFSPLVVGTLLAIAVGYTARSTKNNLSQDTFTLDEYLSELTSAISSLAGRKLKSHETFGGIDDKLKSATSLTKRLLAATKEFNPALKALYDQATFRFKLNSFSRTLHNALHFYGLELDLETQETLSSFQSLSGSDDEWISEASKQLSKKLGTSPSIISLFYYSYTENTEGIRNTWQKIRSNKDDLSSLSRIMVENRTASYLDRSNPKLLVVSEKILHTLETFDPKKFDENLRNFYVNLQSLKESVEHALVRYGFKLDSVQRQTIAEFIPDTEPENWRDELLDVAGGFLHLSRGIIAAFVYENRGDKASVQKTLAKIASDLGEINQLLTVLVNNEIIRIPDRYDTSTNLVLDIISHQIEKRPFLSIEQIRDDLKRYFNELDGGKERLSQALTAYNVKMPVDIRKRFETTYVPLEVSISEMIDFLSANLSIRRELLALFYYEFTQDTPLLQRAFTDIIEHNSIRDLARLLIDLGFIESTEDREIDTDTDNLSSVLKSFQTFRLSAVQSRYQTFRGLLVWSKNLAAFCENKSFRQRLSMSTFHGY